MWIDDSPAQYQREIDLAKRVADVLHSHYPKHLWGVNADLRGGIIQILNMRLSGRWGFVLKVTDVESDPTMKTVVRSGGELLERYQMSRGKFNPDNYQTLKTDFKGDFIADN